MNKVELVTRDALEERLRECLEGRWMPDCFLYLDHSGVENWLNLSSSDQFTVSSRLTDLLKSSLPSVTGHLPRRLDVFSLGAGGGEKERILLESLLERARLRYHPVDISSQMVDAALNAVTDIELEKMGIVAFVEDLESLAQYWSHPLLLCLLGNNFCNYEPEYLLELVRGQLQPDDFFLFDCHLLPARQEGDGAGKDAVERVYRSDLNMRFNVDPLVRRGLEPDDCVFHLDLVSEQTPLGLVFRTRKWLDILRDTSVLCGRDEVHLASGDTVRLGFTYKYTCRQVELLLHRHSFDAVELLLDPDGENLLALVRKRLE